MKGRGRGAQPAVATGSWRQDHPSASEKATKHSVGGVGTPSVTIAHERRARGAWEWPPNAAHSGGTNITALPAQAPGRKQRHSLSHAHAHALLAGARILGHE